VVIHQRFQSRQSLAHLPGRPFVWSDEAVLVDTVEHLNVSVMICTGLLIWHSAHNPMLLSATTTIVRPATIAALALSFVWPNPSAACVDDFAVRGSVVKG